jgi:hypothetical protein
MGERPASHSHTKLATFFPDFVAVERGRGLGRPVATERDGFGYDHGYDHDHDHDHGDDPGWCGLVRDG